MKSGTTILRWLVPVVVMGLLVPGAVVRADIVLDEFDNPAPGVFGAGNQVFTQDGPIGDRTFTITGGPMISGGIGDFPTFGGTQAYLNSGSAVGEAELSYTGLALDAQAEGGTEFNIAFLNIDGGDDGLLPVTITVTDTSNNVSTFTTDVPEASAILPGYPVVATLLAPFAGFTAGADFSSIASIVFMFNGGTNGQINTDFNLTSIVIPAGTAVPEPASLALWSVLGLTGLGMRRRFRGAKLS